MNRAASPKRRGASTAVAEPVLLEASARAVRAERRGRAAEATSSSAVTQGRSAVAPAPGPASGLPTALPAGPDVLPPDLETRLGASDHQALRLWLRLLACTHRIEGQIRARLRAQFNTTLPRFDLMAQLDRHPEGLSMRALSERLMVTGGNVTGVTDQLVQEGWVLREAHPEDRRSCLVRLTPDGRRLFRRMATAHEAWIVELLSGWSGPEQQQVHAQLAQLKQHLTPVSIEASAAVAPRPRRQS